MSALKGWLPDGLPDSALRLLGEDYRYGGYDVVQWDLYHRKAVSTGAERLWFFDQHAGTAPNYYSDTNTQMVSQLPGGQTFITDGLGIIATGKARDVWRRKIAPQGSLQVRVADRIYRHVPLSILPVLDDKAPLYTSVTREVKTPGRAWKVVTREQTRRLYPLDGPRLAIRGNYPYAVVMDFCPSLALRAPVWIGVVLSGWVVRPML